MASLALAASVIMIFIVLVGPFTVLLSRIGTPSFIVYIFSIVSILSGIWFISIFLPIWYIGLFPIYCGYISIKKANSKNDK